MSVVDRMVSKEYVQTAHPYDRDLAPRGAWIEKRTFFQEPLAGDSNCVCDRHWNIGAYRDSKKTACRLACVGVMLQDRTRKRRCSKIEHRPRSESGRMTNMSGIVGTNSQRLRTNKEVPLSARRLL